MAESKRDAQDHKAADEKGRRRKRQGRAARLPKWYGPSPEGYGPQGGGQAAPPPKAPKPAPAQAGPKEIGGRKGPDPTRYGDWEKKGRCIDF